MPSLSDTVAAMVRQKRRLERAREVARTAVRAPSLLTETTGFGANPGDLRMLSYRPDEAPRPSPLVVVLHGCGQTAEAYALGAGWVQLARRFGLELLCPEQQPANNIAGCFNWFLPGDTVRAGEVASIRAMIDWRLGSIDVDPERVFVTGLSAGGAMTSALLASYPGLFAGGAIIAGLPFGAASTIQEAFAAMIQGVVRPPTVWGDGVRAVTGYQGRWPRVSIWQGEADATVKAVNAMELAKQWTDLHGVPLEAAGVETVAGRRRSVWRDASGEPVVELQMLPGLAHGTPISSSGPEACGEAGPFLLEAGVSASLETAAFWGLISEAPSQAPAAPSEQLAMSSPSRPPAARRALAGALRWITRRFGGG